MTAIREVEPIVWVGTGSPAKHVCLMLGPLVDREFLGEPRKEPKWSVGAILPSAPDATHVAVHAGGAGCVYASLEPGSRYGIHSRASGLEECDETPSDKPEAELLADLLESVAADIRKLLAMKAPT